MIEKILLKMNTRSLVVLVLLIGASIIAIKDPPFRSIYGNLCSTAIGGYFGLTYPNSKADDKNTDSG